jgi:hypothetical protein
VGSDHAIERQFAVDPTGVARHLLGRGLLAADDVLGGRFEVAPICRRNNNFMVEVHGRPTYIVKWPSGWDSWSSLANEAATYMRLEPLRRDPDELLWPKLYDYDADKHVVTLQCITSGVDLAEYQRLSRRSPETPARGLAAAMAHVHLRSRDTFDLAELSDPGWPLNIHMPHLGQLPHLPGAVVEAIELIQASTELNSALDALRAEWLTTVLSHGDIRWGNCIVFPLQKRGSKPTRVALIDWELAGPGDPLWDVGCALACYLGEWIASMPLVARMPMGRAVALATRPVDRLQPAMRALWLTYARVAGLTAESDVCLIRAVRMAGGSLVKMAIEQLHAAPRLTAGSLALIQLGANVIARPDEAAERLLGIPLGA